MVGGRGGQVWARRWRRQVDTNDTSCTHFALMRIPLVYGLATLERSKWNAGLEKLIIFIDLYPETILGMKYYTLHNVVI